MGTCCNYRSRLFISAAFVSLGAFHPSATAQSNDQMPATKQDVHSRIRFWIDMKTVCQAPTARLNLLQSKELKDEFKLTEAQRQGVQAVVESARAILMASLDKTTANVEESLETQVERNTKKLELFLQKFEQPALDTLLTLQQNRRLNQVTWQSEGVNALFMPEVIKLLELTDHQMRELERRNRDLLLLYQGGGKAAQLSGLVVSGGPKGTQAYKEWVELNREAEAAMWKVLTPDQESKWREFVGKPVRR